MRVLSPAACLLVPLIGLGLLPADRCPPKPTCSYAVVPAASPMRATGGNILVRVTTGSNCTWTYAGNVPWITVETDGDATGPTGKGPGSVIVVVAPNPDAARRTGTATVAGQTITVDQAGTGGSGCTFTVSPAESTFTGGGAGSGEFTITASAADCGWTASRGSVLEDTVSLTAGGSGGNITVRDSAQQAAATHHVRFQ